MYNQINCKILQKAVMEMITSGNNFYGYFATYFSFQEFSKPNSDHVAAVKAERNKLTFYYNSSNLERFCGNDINKAKLIVYHELNHILLKHHIRYQGSNQKIWNIAADMIVNDFIKTDYNITSDNALYIPEEYTGDKITELLYNWLLENSEELEGLPEGFDDHDIMRESTEDCCQMCDDIVAKIKARGTSPSDNVSKHMEWEPKKTKVNIFKQVMGKNSNDYDNTYRKFNRRIETKKGRIKQGKRINIILDTSGSLFDELEEYVGYVFGEYETRVIQIDTEIRLDKVMRSVSELKRLEKNGCGGTILMPAIEKLVKDRDFAPLYIVTDGMTDVLDFTNYKGKVTVITCGSAPEYVGSCNIVMVKEGEE